MPGATDAVSVVLHQGKTPEEPNNVAFVAFAPMWGGGGCVAYGQYNFPVKRHSKST